MTTLYFLVKTDTSTGKKKRVYLDGVPCSISKEDVQFSMRKMNIKFNPTYTYEVVEGAEEAGKYEPCDEKWNRLFNQQLALISTK